MKINKLAFTTIALITSLSFPLSALALDARDFADKLSANINVNGGFEIIFNSATLDGDTITLSDWSMPALGNSRAAQILNTPIIFYGVKEIENGGYSAKSAKFENIDYTDDGVNIKVNDILFEKILVPANPEEDILASMMLYQKFSTGSISVAINGEEVASISSIITTNEPNDDKTIFLSMFEINDIFGDLSKIEEEAARVGLAAVGLNAIEGRIYGDAIWTLENGRIKMDELSFDFKNIGKLDMGMDFSGFTIEMVKDLQSVNKEMAKLDPSSQEYEAKSMEMLMSMAERLSFNEFSISFTDDGITTKILDLVAAKQGTTRDEMVPGLAMMAPMFLADFDVPELQSQVGKAVGAYLTDPKNIGVKVKPENSTPIMAFVALANNPPALLDLLNINVSANQ